MPSSHLILCCPILLLPPIPPSIRVFSNESTLHMRWPKYWSLSFSIIPSKEIPGLISFTMDWLDLLAVQGTLKSLLQHRSSKASILQHSAFFTVKLWAVNLTCLANLFFLYVKLCWNNTHLSNKLPPAHSNLQGHLPQSVITVITQNRAYSFHESWINNRIHEEASCLPTRGGWVFPEEQNLVPSRRQFIKWSQKCVFISLVWREQRTIIKVTLGHSDFCIRYYINLIGTYV